MRTRRSMLAGCGAVLGTATLAGCSVLESGSGGPPDYSDWFYAASAPHVGFTYLQLEEMLEVEGIGEGFTFEADLGIPVERVNEQVRYRSSVVLWGAFSAEELTSGLEEAQELSLEPLDSTLGYQRYRHDDSEYYDLAVRDGAAVIGRERPVDPLLEAGEEGTDRLIDEHDDLDLLVNELGLDQQVSGTIELDDGSLLPGAQVATGRTVEYGAEAHLIRRVVVFETESDVDEAGVRSEWAGEDRVQDLSTSTDGRLVIATYRAPREEN